jgi:hypothetical protein
MPKAGTHSPEGKATVFITAEWKITYSPRGWEDCSGSLGFHKLRNILRFVRYF